MLQLMSLLEIPSTTITVPIEKTYKPSTSRNMFTATMLSGFAWKREPGERVGLSGRSLSPYVQTSKTSGYCDKYKTCDLSPEQESPVQDVGAFSKCLSTSDKPIIIIAKKADTLPAGLSHSSCRQAANPASPFAQAQRKWRANQIRILQWRK